MKHRRSLSALIVTVFVISACSGGDKAAAPASSPSSSSNPTSTSDANSGAPAVGGADWTAWGHDGARSGVTADGPSAQGLHQAWTSDALDGEVYAQPLVVGDNVIVATENNSVYAFDAVTGAPKWQQLHLGDPIAGASLPCGNVDPVGITSTPVADAANNRLYVVGMMQPAHHELFALALDTGAVVFHRGVDAGDPKVQNQRGALSLANGKVYVPFGGRFGDCGDYKGRISAVSSDGSGNPMWYSIRANREGGLWAPPGLVVAPDGTLLGTTGNSDGTDTFDDGNAVLRLNENLAVVDEFAPSDWPELNARDGDLGTTSPALLPNQRVFQVGKSGVGYVLDATHFGDVGGDLHHEQVCSRVMGGLAHDGDVVFAPCSDGLKALRIGDDTFTTLWTAAFDNPGPPIEAAGLLWVLDVESGILHALDAQSGRGVFSADVGAVTHFSAAAAGDGTVFVAGGQKVEAFRSASPAASAAP